MNIRSKQGHISTAITRLLSCAAIVLLVCQTGLGDSPDQPDNPSNPSVGVSAQISDIILPGTKLTTKAIDDSSPIVLRIENVRVHGTAHRYDFVYFGLEPGEYDLRDYLVRVDGGDTSDLPAIPVSVVSVLEKGQVTPNSLPDQSVPKIGGYRLLMWLLGAVWVIGLLLLIFWPKSRREQAARKGPKPTTLADRLRPFVESAVRGELSDPDKAELERLLLAYWHDKLDVRDLPPAQAIEKLRSHESAGKLFRSLEDWLHRPDASNPTDEQVRDLLQPYQDVAV